MIPSLIKKIVSIMTQSYWYCTLTVEKDQEYSMMYTQFVIRYLSFVDKIFTINLKCHSFFYFFDQYNLSMTTKCSKRQQPRAPKIMLLQINSDLDGTIKRKGFNSRKLKKINCLETSNYSKGIKNLQKISFDDLLKETETTQRQPPPSTQRSRQSSYLAYKADQKCQKSKFGSPFNFLKSRLHQRKYSLDAKIKQNCLRQRIETVDVVQDRKKLSLIQLGQAFSSESEDAQALSRSKNFYIKTCEGKRQRITVDQYMIKIKQKMQNLSERQDMKDIHSFKNFWGNNEEISFRVNQFNPERHTVTRKNVSRTTKKYITCLKVDDNNNDCRPWSSKKSQPTEQ